MPWLQEPSVIYHHPLDSVAESRRLKNWTLVKGSFSSAKVPMPVAVGGAVGEPDPSSLSFGGTTIFEGLTENIFIGGGTVGQATSAIALDSTRALMMWYSNLGGSPDGVGDAASHIGAAAVMTTTGETSFTITGENDTALHEKTKQRTTYIDSSLLESGTTARVLVAFRFRDLFQSSGRIKVISVTGGSLSAGTTGFFVGTAALEGPVNVGCEALNSNTFLVAWTASDDNESFIRAGTASGFSISVGASNNFETQMRSTNLVRLTSTKALLVYLRTAIEGTLSPPGTAYARVVEVVGGLVTVGPRFALPNTAKNLGAAALSSTKVVIVQDINPGATIATISGTTVTFGPQVSKSFSVQVAERQIIPVSPISSSVFAVVFGGGSAVAVIGTVAGTSITFGTTETAFGSGVGHVAGCVVGVPGANPTTTNGSHIFAMFSVDPSSNNNEGRAALTSINYDSEVTRIGGSGYVSTIGSTKLAYTAWLQDPI